MLVCVTSKGAGSPFSPSRVTHGRGHEEKFKLKVFFHLGLNTVVTLMGGT